MRYMDETNSTKWSLRPFNYKRPAFSNYNGIISTLGNCIETVHVVQAKFVHQLKGSTKMTPILYYLAPSPPCRSILLLAKMLDIQLDLKVINILKGEQLQSEFIEMNPQHCIPTLNDNGLILWESRAILSYLVSAFAKDDTLYPKDVRLRALVDQRLMFDLGTLYQRMTEYFFPTMFMGAPLDEGNKSKLHEALGWLDAILRKHKYAATEQFTIADLTLLVTVSQIDAFGFDLHQYKSIQDWYKCCREYMEPYDYETINLSQSMILADMLKSQLQKN